MSSDTPPDDFDALKIIVDALKPFKGEDQERILRWVREKFGLIQPTEPTREEVVTATFSPQQGHPGGGRTKDIKSFVLEKNPQSDNQFAATVAYYYRFEAPESLRKAEITAGDVQDATRLAGRARLGDPSKTIRNAVQQGYFDQAGRGAYTLSTVGENLVAMALPATEGRSARGTIKVRRTKTAKKGGRSK